MNIDKNFDGCNIVDMLVARKEFDELVSHPIRDKHSLDYE